MGESIGRVILQGMLEDAWDKGVEQERRNTEKEREHAIVAFISFGIPKEKILVGKTDTTRANFKIYNAKDKYLISANFSFNKYAYASAQSGIKF